MTKRSKSFLASESNIEFVQLNEWQLAEIKDALIEAENEDFASDSDVEKAFAKWSSITNVDA